MWYLDSGCSKHMTGDKSKFSNLIPRSKGFVTYGDNNKGRILGIGTIGTPPFTTIDNTLCVEGLKHNLLSISQLCDKDLTVIFNKRMCIVEDENTHEVKLKGKRVNNIYMLSLDDPSLKLKCLVTNNNNDA